MIAAACPPSPGERLVALRNHFLELFGVAVLMGVASAARFYR
jgi:ATP-binding cassette subfamily B protein